MKGLDMNLNRNRSLQFFGFGRSRQCFVAAVFGALLLTGCATTSVPMGSDGQPNIDGLMSQAENEMTRGRRDQAIALFNQAAKESPTNMAPWLKIANIWFDESNYPSTILAANEVLARDSTNQEAKSLLVVAGLRVAANAVKDLVPHNPVNPNARQEAENLTKSLRLALGEKVLVPADPNISSAKAPRPRIRAKKAVVKAEPIAKPAVSVAAGPANVQLAAQPKVSVSVDPFKSLK